MVCNRCILAVESILRDLDLHLTKIELGEVDIEENSIEHVKQLLLNKLQAIGFDLIGDKKSKLIEQIKTLIIDLVQNKNNQIKINLSDYLSQQLSKDYSALSALFSEVEGTTIEKYYINLKIEKVKEYLIYDEMSLSEIAYFLNYSSVSHLSKQFKKATGLTPSYFKQLKNKKRKQIELL